ASSWGDPFWPWGDPFPYEFRWPTWPPHYVPPYRYPTAPEYRFCPCCGRRLGYGYTTPGVVWGRTTTTNTTDGVAWQCGESDTECSACGCEKDGDEQE